MKKPIGWLVVLFLFTNVFCTKDKNPAGTSDEEGFAFYLIADSASTIWPSMQSGLDSYLLSATPLFGAAELDYYDWRDHRFSVRNEVFRNIMNLVRSRQSVHGIPFLVVAQGSRRYAGAFWFGYSSIAPTFPYIESDLLLSQDDLPPVLKIEKGLFMETDLRNDPLVYDALKKAHKLIE